MPFSTILTALFCPYIAHERNAQNLILSVRSLRFALCLKERHRSQNQGSLKSEERKSNFKERCAQLCKIHRGADRISLQLFDKNLNRPRVPLMGSGEELSCN